MNSGGKLPESLLTIEDAINMSRQENRDYYRRFINPALVSVISLIDFDKQFVRAQGECIWDSEGRQYLDFLGGYGALNLGHNPSEVLAAVKAVMERPNILQAALNPLASVLAHNLAQVTPGDLEKVFFCNSGTEAVEGALKLARAAMPGRKKIIYCENSFHGKSYGSLSVTGRTKYQKPFIPMLPDCEPVAFGDLPALEQKLSARDAAAFIVEPIQGEGGVNVPSEGYLASVRGICDSYGTLLIADEIQTGFGRTGRLFACEHDRVVPDIMCLAKSLGGGVMPIGAYIARPGIWDTVYNGMDKYALHTSTFGGNTLAMAAGIAALAGIVGQNLALQAQEKGVYLIGKLQEMQQRYNLIKDVRGRGLLIGLEFKQPVAGTLDKLTGGKVNELAGEYFGSLVAGKLMNKHQIITAYTLNNPNVIRLEPPLTVSTASIDRVLEAFEAVFEMGGFAKVTLSSVGTAIRSILK